MYGYFARKYFAPRYYAPRYFPPVIVVAVTERGQILFGAAEDIIERYNDDHEVMEIIMIITASGILEE